MKLPNFSILSFVSLTLLTLIKSILSGKNGLEQYDIGKLDNLRVMAYIDYNLDKYVDMIVVSRSNITNQELIQIYLYDENKNKFELKRTNREILGGIEGRIINIIPADFNNDKRLDLLVSLVHMGNIVYHYILLQDETIDDYFKINNNLILITPIQESSMFVGDFNGDTIPDIMVYNTTSQKRSILYLEKGRNYEFKQFSFESIVCPESKSRANKKLSYPHSSAFLDLDGDCKNDLFLTTYNDTKFAEVWKGSLDKNGKISYCLIQEFPIDNTIGEFTFSDIDRNGFIDIIFPIYQDTSFSLGISYNQVTTDVKLDEDYCELVKGSTTIFSTIDNTTNNYSTQMIISNKQLFLDNYTLYREDDIYLQPIIRVGDIDADSFPDILFTIENIIDKSRKSIVLLNTPISKGLSSSGPVRRTFEYNNSYIINNTDVIYASFYDIGETGQLDLILVSKTSNNIYQILAYMNYYQYDAYFLKSVHLLHNGVFFSNIIGTNYRYISCNLDGSNRVDTSVQSPQNSNIQLTLPYCYIGIGRSNSFVQNYNIITPIYNKNYKNSKLFTPIIPNSHLIISSEPSELSLTWKLELIVNPISKILLLIFIIVIILVVILIFIIILHIKEKEEDIKEKRLDFW